jgi:hypothetical protein
MLYPAFFTNTLQGKSGAFRVKKQDSKKLRNRKRRIERRLAPRNWTNQETPFFRAGSIDYEVGGRARTTLAGGIGAIHRMVSTLGLVDLLDESVPLLKRHLPYHESDHILNIAFNVMAGHTRLEDLEAFRQDEAYMDMLGASRIPDPTTAGDFLRRFAPHQIETLMDTVNQVRQQVWLDSDGLGSEAIIDVDGSFVSTLGQKKEGISYSYKKTWGYHPLLVSLANTREPLFVVNRRGNVASHADSTKWLDKAIEVTKPVFDKVPLRGDTDFSLTGNFDRWTRTGVGFVFGYDAKPNLVELADALGKSAWRPFIRPKKYQVQTEPREKRENTKEQIVLEKGWQTLRLQAEEIAEFAYRPIKCRETYRVVVIKKNIGVSKGETYLFDDIRYFFYITNQASLPPTEVVKHANARCNQENLIEQLKNGVNALRVPVYDLNSNWAYMVIASLAWTFKAWFALSLPKKADRRWILAMEFKLFLNQIILIPCQVIRGARRIKLRIQGYTEGVKLLFSVRQRRPLLSTA